MLPIVNGICSRIFRANSSKSLSALELKDKKYLKYISNFTSRLILYIERFTVL